MITLVLEEDRVLCEDQVVSDLTTFLKELAPDREITLFLKTHEVIYHCCPVRKALRYMKSAEYSAEYWVGEKKLPKGQIFLGGILPTPFMRNTIQLISEHYFAVKGIFLWSEMIVQAYAPVPTGWTLILHDQELFVCQDGILRFSRHCFQPLVKELPSILRYLKRFGYEKDSPVTLIASEFSDSLPPFVHFEMRKPCPLSSQGVRLQIPEINHLCRLYSTPRMIHRGAYGLSFLCATGAVLLSWQALSGSWQVQSLRNEVETFPISGPLDGTKMETFANYQRLTQERSHFLKELRHLIPLIKNQAVATHLHWTTNSLVLHLELSPTVALEQLWAILQSQFVDHYHLTWSPLEEEPLKGVLTIEKKDCQRVGRS